MNLNQIPKRDLKNVGPNIWSTIAVMERYGAQLTHDSGHDNSSGEKATTWIFTFPDFQDAQIAVAMNKQKLSLLMRGKTLGGLALQDAGGNLAKVERVYVNSDKGVASSVLGHRAPFLNPSAINPLLRVVPNAESVDALLALYLDSSAKATGLAATQSPASIDESPNELSDTSEKSGGSAGSARNKKPVSADELQLQLDRNAETGRAGEMIAVLDELKRLGECECPDPAKFVERVALSDVGRGYDIASTWPGQERCIEVKSTTVDGSAFYVTENERQVLTKLGDKAWLYRVLVGSHGNGAVTARLQNPMLVIRQEQLEPVLWRVTSDALKSVEVVS